MDASKLASAVDDDDDDDLATIFKQIKLVVSKPKQTKSNDVESEHIADYVCTNGNPVKIELNLVMCRHLSKFFETRPANTALRNGNGIVRVNISNVIFTIRMMMLLENVWEGITGWASKLNEKTKQKIVQGLVGVNKCLTSCFFVVVVVGIASYCFCCAASVFRTGENALKPKKF